MELTDKLLAELRDAAVLQEAVGSHYELLENTNRKLADRGKFGLVPRQDIQHGRSNTRDTVNALLMALDVELNGNIVEELHKPGSFNEGNVRKAVTNMLSPAGASVLAGIGLRGGDLATLSPEERLLRAGDRAITLDKGYNTRTGSLLEGVGLDGGHVLPHDVFPEYSKSRWNMDLESKYENRTKGSKTGEALIRAFTNSLRKRLGNSKKEGPVSPSQFVNTWNVGKGFTSSKFHDGPDDLSIVEM